MTNKRGAGTSRAVLLTIALLMVLITVPLLAFWYLNRSAPNATMAMAKGQYELASEYLTTKANAGDIAAQNSLGNLYYLGLGVQQDFAHAANLYFKSASANYAPAQLNLANLYKQGLGVSQNPMKAFGWYRMSDINGNPQAEYYMSQIAIEFTLSPLQISTVNKQWAKLNALVQEGL